MRFSVRVNGDVGTDQSDEHAEHAELPHDGVPWGWLLIVAVLAACIYYGPLDKTDHPNDWIDGSWSGTLQLAERGQIRREEVNVIIETRDSFMQTHRAEGTIQPSPGAQRQPFAVHSLEIRTDNFQVNKPPIRIAAGAYKITGDVDADDKAVPVSDPDLLEGMTGFIRRNLLYLESGPGSGGTSKQVVLRIKPLPSRFDAVEDVWSRISLFVLAFPLILGLYLFRYKPWKANVWTIIMLTVFAGATFGLTWIIALLIAVAGRRLDFDSRRS